MAGSGKLFTGQPPGPSSVLPTPFQDGGKHLIPQRIYRKNLEKDHHCPPRLESEARFLIQNAFGIVVWFRFHMLLFCCLPPGFCALL